MSGEIFPEPPTSFQDVLEAALYHIWNMDVNGYGRRMYERYPYGHGSLKEERESLFPLLMAFAVKEHLRIDPTEDAA